MEDVNYIERWVIQRSEPKGIIKVRVEFADGTDHVMVVSPGKVGTDIVEGAPGCWHCTAVVAAEASAIFILGTYRFGPFSSVEFANRFGMRLMECVNDPNPSKYEAGQIAPPDDAKPIGLDDATNAVLAGKYRRLLAGGEVDGYELLTRDVHERSERYRQLAEGDTVDNERLVNATIYSDFCRNAEKYTQLRHGQEVDGHVLLAKDIFERATFPPADSATVPRATYDNLTRESQSYRQLLDGNDVEGQRLLPVATIQRMARMEFVVKNVISTIDDALNPGDLTHLSFELRRLD